MKQRRTQKKTTRQQALWCRRYLGEDESDETRTTTRDDTISGLEGGVSTNVRLQNASGAHAHGARQRGKYRVWSLCHSSLRWFPDAVNVFMVEHRIVRDSIAYDIWSCVMSLELNLVHQVRRFSILPENSWLKCSPAMILLQIQDFLPSTGNR